VNATSMRNVLADVIASVPEPVRTSGWDNPCGGHIQTASPRPSRGGHC
jgi:hypothetical protein